jgi:hypothetical protein
MTRTHSYERSVRNLKRAKPKKAPYDRILIVCEGEKTEVNYFKAIQKDLRIPNSHVKVVPSNRGTEPLKIIESAENLFLTSRAFEHVFLVFDRDTHKTYHDALNKVSSLFKKFKNDENKFVSFIAIPSVPNFELWILLHFKDIHAFIDGNDVYSKLIGPRNYPSYKKNSETVYKDTEEYIQFAADRAKRLRERYTAHSGTDPYTDVDILTGLMRGYADRLLG